MSTSYTKTLGPGFNEISIATPANGTGHGLSLVWTQDQQTPPPPPNVVLYWPTDFEPGYPKISGGSQGWKILAKRPDGAPTVTATVTVHE